jgi:drug/metabolite transporter (DMT)-like permease
MHAQSVSSDHQSTSFAKGAMFIILGSSSYGMLSTFVKLSYKQNYTTAEITLAQFIWGALALTILGQFFNKSKTPLTKDEMLKLMFVGLPIGFTSIFYYLAVKYITASVGVVLLMQSVWIGVFLESVLTKKFPSIDKIAAVILIIFGTLLATQVLGQASTSLDIRGVILGLMSAMSFSCTLMASSKVLTNLPPIKRSQFMLYGGTIAAIIFAVLTQIAPYYFNIHLVGEEFIKSTPFKMHIFLSYGLIVAIFGTVIPPIMLNKGFPIVGVGIGSILSSIELPFANIIAFLLLGEKNVGMQWVGVLIIIAAICMMNYRMIFSKKTRLPLDNLTN